MFTSLKCELTIIIVINIDNSSNNSTQAGPMVTVIMFQVLSYHYSLMWRGSDQKSQAHWFLISLHLAENKYSVIHSFSIPSICLGLQIHIYISPQPPTT